MNYNYPLCIAAQLMANHRRSTRSKLESFCQPWLKSQSPEIAPAMRLTVLNPRTHQRIGISILVDDIIWQQSESLLHVRLTGRLAPVSPRNRSWLVWLDNFAQCQVEFLLSEGPEVCTITARTLVQLEGA